MDNLKKFELANENMNMIESQNCFVCNSLLLESNQCQQNDFRSYSINHLPENQRCENCETRNSLNFELKEKIEQKHLKSSQKMFPIQFGEELKKAEVSYFIFYD